MNIGIDIRSILEEKRSGVGEYAFRLLNAVFSIDKKNKYFLFYNSYKDKDNLLPKNWQNLPNVTFVKFNYPNKILNLSLKFLHFPKVDELIYKKTKIPLDIFFLPSLNFIALSKKIKKIITAHDLSFERYPQFFSWKMRFWHWLINPKKLFMSFDKIIAISENTKNDLKSIYRIDEEKIKLVHSGTIQEEEISFDEEEKRKVKEKYGLPNDFILFVGTLEPRKNIEGLVRAFEILKDAEREELKDLNLVILGPRGWLYKKILQRAKKSPYANQIIFVDYVSEEEKFYFYQLAKIFVYISFYEGFGFPPLEAAACGTPVVTSSVSAILEVMADSALLIDPNNPAEAAEIIKQYLTNENLREKMIVAGKERVRRFGWEEGVKKVLDLL
jgi:glycosyltransferase involved in cell wall biosynthesis